MSKLKKRKVCYICNPKDLDLFCPKNEKHKITWSEYEQHIWCYDCQQDIGYEPGFSGPIPVEIAKMLGIDYRKYNIKTGKIIKQNDNKQNRITQST